MSPDPRRITRSDGVLRALIVVAKRPSVGKTKTRLSPPLSGSEAAALYHCFLLDTLDLMRYVQDVQPVVAYLPYGSESFFRGIAPPGFDLVPQTGDDLGQRLDNVLRSCLGLGYSQAVVMNSDGPTLPVEYLALAFEKLNDPAVDVVLGPIFCLPSWHDVDTPRELERLIAELSTLPDHIARHTRDLLDSLYATA